MGFLRDILQRPKNERAYLLMVTGKPAPGTQVPDIQRKPLRHRYVRRIRVLELRSGQSLRLVPSLIAFVLSLLFVSQALVLSYKVIGAHEDFGRRTP